MPKRMQNQESWDVITPAEEAEIRELVVPNQYRVILPHELPVFLPASLRNKIINGIVMATDVSSGWVFVANWQRVEVNTREIDQEPFGIFLLSGSTNTPALSSGMYLHHGDWPGRTKAIPFEVASS